MSRIHLSKADITELDRIRQRYSDRQTVVPADRYSIKRNDVFLGTQHVDRVTLDLLKLSGFDDFARVRLLEVGCGSGGNLLRFLRWGFAPENLVGNELLDERAVQARNSLPAKRVTVDHLRELFPEGQLTSRRVTLAPPIARRVSRLRPVYVALNALPFLRTHSVCVIREPHMAVLT
jgi:hypothetical protein